MAKKATKPVTDEVIDVESEATEEAEPTTDAEKRMYEVMLVLKPDMLESNFKKKLKEFKIYLEEHDCKVTEEDIWEKRRLAYRIKQYDEAIYVVYNFESPTAFIKDLENHLRIDNDVIRHLVVTIPEGYKYIKFYEIEEEKPPKHVSTPPTGQAGKKDEKTAVSTKKLKPAKEESKKKTEEGEEKEIEELKEKLVEADEQLVEYAEKEAKEAEEKAEKAKKKLEKDEEELEGKKQKKPGLFSKLLGKKEKKEEEPKDEKSEEKISRSELDEKLDKLLGGDDLNI